MDFIILYYFYVLPILLTYPSCVWIKLFITTYLHKKIEINLNFFCLKGA